MNDNNIDSSLFYTLLVALLFLSILQSGYTLQQQTYGIVRKITLILISAYRQLADTVGHIFGKLFQIHEQ
mgnify:CR=1 FL=1